MWLVSWWHTVWTVDPYNIYGTHIYICGCLNKSRGILFYLREHWSWPAINLDIRYDYTVWCTCMYLSKRCGRLFSATHPDHMNTTLHSTLLHTAHNTAHNTAHHSTLHTTCHTPHYTSTPHNTPHYRPHYPPHYSQHFMPVYTPHCMPHYTPHFAPQLSCVVYSF